MARKKRPLGRYDDGQIARHGDEQIKTDIKVPSEKTLGKATAKLEIVRNTLRGDCVAVCGTPLVQCGIVIQTPFCPGGETNSYFIIAFSRYGHWCELRKKREEISWISLTEFLQWLRS